MNIFTILITVLKIFGLWQYVTLDPVYDLLGHTLIGFGNIVVKLNEIIKYGESMDESTFPPGLPIDEEYDFIIAGASPAGCVLANRLSKKYKVLLLEPGLAEPPAARLALYAPLMQYLENLNWNRKVYDEPNAGRGMKDGIINYPGGRCLGGNSCINYMIYTRGNAQVFNKLGAENSGWSWSEVLEIYKFLEKKVEIKYSDTGCHGESGELGVSDAFTNQLIETFIAAGQELNYPIRDYNCGNQTSFSNIQATLKDGRRQSAGSAFLFPIRTRTNLHIRTMCTVEKVLFDNNVATGVQYYYEGQVRTVKARKEVIVSAGGLISPQILMLSGIGPKTELDKFNIPVLRDCGVGTRFFDHAAYVGLVYSLKVEGLTLTPVDFVNPVYFLQWFLGENSRINSLGAISGIAYPGDPNLELLTSIGSLVSELGVTANRFNVDLGKYLEYWGPLLFQGPYRTATYVPQQLEPHSCGYLNLTSKNIFDPPLFHPRFYTDAEGKDMNEMIAAIRKAIAIVKTEAFAKLGATLYLEPVPGCERYTYDTDPYWKCAINTFTVSLWHQVGACWMGNTTDSIVDNQGRVREFKNLRVADISILPYEVAAHTYAPALMIGEKISRYILAEYGN